MVFVCLVHRPVSRIYGPLRRSKSSPSEFSDSNCQIAWEKVPNRAHIGCLLSEFWDTLYNWLQTTVVMMMDTEMALVCLAHRSVSRIYGPFIILKILTQIAKLREKELQQVTKLHQNSVTTKGQRSMCTQYGTFWSRYYRNQNGSKMNSIKKSKLWSSLPNKIQFSMKVIIPLVSYCDWFDLGSKLEKHDTELFSRPGNTELRCKTLEHLSHLVTRFCNTLAISGLPNDILIILIQILLIPLHSWYTIYCQKGSRHTHWFHIKGTLKIFQFEFIASFCRSPLSSTFPQRNYTEIIQIFLV